MRRITAVANVVAATSVLMAGSVAPASAIDDSVAAYDRYVLDSHQDGYGGIYAGFPDVPGDGLIKGATVTDYCNRVGFSSGAGQCHLESFHETERTHWEEDYRQIASGKPLTNCNEKAVDNPSVSWSHTQTATHTAGGSISLAKSIGFTSGIPLFSVSSSMTLTVTATYSYAWGESTTKSDTYPVQISPGYEGWLDYAGFHGTAHGVATVTIEPNGDPNNPATELGHGSTFKVITDITGDLPKPPKNQEEAVNAQPVYDRLVTGHRRLSNDELRVACPDWQKDLSGNLLEWDEPANSWVRRYDNPVHVDFIV
ncbi:hypothetical protein AB0D12_36190 [Streptomyces sp. NPDC048479]|uniref:hypothetical protein n=1 Tax=Streptomyces sp. NPDC048479 TaxID=3154725 RepID=UPI00341CC1D9